MVMQRLLASLAFCAAGTSGPAAAQDAEPSAPDIVVTGQRTEEAIQSFVDQLTVQMRGADQVARWDRRICPGVAGLRARYAQFLIDRMAQRAFDVGLDVGEPGCRANILIIVSLDPDAIAEDLFENHRDAMGYYDERGQTTLGRDALRAFVGSDAPVRWWHVGRTHTQAGEAVRETANPASLLGGAPVLFRFGGPSRISRTMREDFGVAFIIVDAGRMAEIDLDFNALADYLAMVTLAQVDPEADTNDLSTILNLFGAPNAPHELTEWDIAYLRGVYTADREDSSARQQGEIARTMNQDLQAQE
jgi:hypothetical protein